MTTPDFSHLKGVSLAICIPIYNNYMLTAQSYMIQVAKERAKQLEVKLDILTVEGESLVTRARNSLVHLYLHTTECKYMLFIDADILWENDAIFRMLSQLEKDDAKEIMGAIYPKKDTNIERIVHWARTMPELPPQVIEMSSHGYVADFTGNGEGTTREDLIKQFEAKDDRSDFLMNVRFLPTGFMMIRRSLLQRLPDLVEKHTDLRLWYNRGMEMTEADKAREGGKTPDMAYAYFDTMIHPETKQYLSEDWMFCYLLNKCNIKRWAHLGIGLTHVGNIFYHKGHIAGIYYQAKLAEFLENQKEVMEREEAKKKYQEKKQLKQQQQLK